MDGVGGTVCAGTGYYLKKEALYGSPINQDNMTPLFLKAQSEYKWESQLYQSGLQLINLHRIVVTFIF